MSMNELHLQKLVDGELTDEQRAQLLSQLQSAESVENWRTLALSFVENQVLSQALAHLESPPMAQPVREMPAHSPVKTPFWKRRVHPWMSVAASLLLGVSMGIGGHFWMKEAPSATGSGPLAAAGPAALPFSPAAAGREAAYASVPGNLVGSGTAGSGPGARIGIGSPRPAPVMNLNLSGLGNKESDPVPVPVYSGEEWPELNGAAVVPEEVLRSLEAQGLTLDRERQWLRARLNDGREVLVPTETLRVRNAVQ
jgi:hypothetical protein